MKTMARIFISALMIFNFACSHNIQNQYTAPTIKTQQRLIYPKAAQEKLISGKTKVMLGITEKGTVDTAYVIKSAGDADLDNAAVEYCRKIEFTPALYDGEPIFFRMTMTVDFEISSLVPDVKIYAKEINSMYSLIERSEGSKKNELLDSLLEMHDQFLLKMSDGLNFNKYISQIIQPSISSDWKTVWDSFPITFLIYYDFIMRFPDYDSLKIVKGRMLDAMEQDIHYIKSVHNGDKQSELEKNKLLDKIQAFLRINFPEVKLDRFESHIISTMQKEL